MCPYAASWAKRPVLSSDLTGEMAICVTQKAEVTNAVNIMADLEYVLRCQCPVWNVAYLECRSCGGCVTYSLGGDVNSDGGRDCSAIFNVSSVRCQQGKCMIGMCSLKYFY